MGGVSGFSVDSSFMTVSPVVVTHHDVKRSPPTDRSPIFDKNQLCRSLPYVLHEVGAAMMEKLNK